MGVGATERPGMGVVLEEWVLWTRQMTAPEDTRMPILSYKLAPAAEA
jgi:hypothetical protein